MRVLIIGGGGREHALAWKVAQSPRTGIVFVAPGNAGTAGEPGVQNVPLSSDDIPALVNFARREHIELTIVGPEAPLVAGVVDAFQEAGLRCFGPTRKAAQLEGSKSFSKLFLARYGIPTAAFAVFADPEEARHYICEHGVPIVIKADGLAAGKGVVVAQTIEEATAAVDQMLSGQAFGEAGKRVVIEDFLHGEEASFIVMADGEHVLTMATSQDHKARDNGDHGPNTGGMGAYSPAPVVRNALAQRILSEIIRPAISGMAAEGTPYTGFLYAGIMITPEGDPKVLEFNCRLGDPEAQPILLRLRSDLVELCDAALHAQLEHVKANWDSRVALGVVMAAGGYPGEYRKGDWIQGIPKETPSSKVFHAGTALQEDHVVTAGGRVLCACCLGNTVTQAQRAAYEIVHQIRWRDAYYRTDIGYRAIAREQSIR